MTTMVYPTNTKSRITNTNGEIATSLDGLGTRNDRRGLLTDSLYWRGLRFEGLEADTSKIKYTSIEYAGLDTAAIIFGDAINTKITDIKIYQDKPMRIFKSQQRW